MGFDIQFKSNNGCIYVFEQNSKQWYEFCPVNELPIDVKKQVNEIKEKADTLKDA